MSRRRPAPSREVLGGPTLVKRAGCWGGSTLVKKGGSRGGATLVKRTALCKVGGPTLVEKGAGSNS